MTLALIVLILGLILFFVPAGPPPVPPGYWTTAGKVNAVGWILIFWGVYLVVAALGVSVRLLR